MEQTFRFTLEEILGRYSHWVKSYRGSNRFLSFWNCQFFWDTVFYMSSKNRRFQEIQLENDYSGFTIPKNIKEPGFMLTS